MATKTVRNVLWSVLSAAVSALFLGHGSWLLLQAGIETAAVVFGVATLLYGVISLALLALAWGKPNKHLALWVFVIAGAFLLFQLAVSLDLGIISGLEWAALLLVAVMLSANWKAVRNVANRRLSGRTHQ